MCEGSGRGFGSGHSPSEARATPRSPRYKREPYRERKPQAWCSRRSSSSTSLTSISVWSTRVQNGYANLDTSGHARPPRELRNRRLSSENVPARARKWTPVPHSSFPRNEGVPVRVRASAFLTYLQGVFSNRVSLHEGPKPRPREPRVRRRDLCIWFGSRSSTRKAVLGSFLASFGSGRRQSGPADPSVHRPRPDGLFLGTEEGVNPGSRPRRKRRRRRSLVFASL